MAVTTRAALEKLKSHLAKCGYLGKVEFGDPLELPNDWDTFITLLRYEAKPGEESTCNSTIERRVITIRVYTCILSEPRPDMELKMDEVAVKLHEDILEDSTLGDTVRFVNWPTVDFLHDTIKEQAYRVIQMTWALTIDDSVTL